MHLGLVQPEANPRPGEAPAWREQVAYGGGAAGHVEDARSNSFSSSSSSSSSSNGLVAWHGCRGSQADTCVPGAAARKTEGWGPSAPSLDVIDIEKGTVDADAVPGVQPS
ncbi:hypothetical protein PCL_05945 [Purpureocillium lilacinum]|uniref:Uncharacterized protein n=1 Tax=Purpureocillium lilacinum TaxID=33203 RepID=A0A2U3EL94_PURLI|nr:hypothetical protein PCL_05945 [Purpureocillium lilacinum]